MASFLSSAHAEAPRERPPLAAAKSSMYLQEYGRKGAEKGWRFLTGDQPQIAELAKTYALRARNWALVGNGSNRIAAEEIRIKLSELCYKAIPSDVTEDKKHIDLSTEPLTIVVANDLPEEVVQDTVKETAIFKAHNGRPLVLCSARENRFDSVAQAVLKLRQLLEDCTQVAESIMTKAPPSPYFGHP